MLVKICGLTNVAAVEACATADAVGFVLSKSPRMVTRKRAPVLIEQVPAGILRVGVFRSFGPAELDVALELDLDGVQANAGSPSAHALPDDRWFLPVFYDGFDLAARVASYRGPRPRHGPFEGAILVDGPQGGGRGIRADWDRIGALDMPVVLAGGLDPANVGEAIEQARPIGVDVSSGVELALGVKDPDKIREFIAAARAAGEER